MKRVAKRLQPFPDGNFKPSPQPQLLDRLTDEDLLVAADAVEAVMAEQQPRPSGKAQFRLLAWTVADARGATTPLDKPLAETVGKRLDRQAQKVRGDVAVVRECARERRELLSIAARADHRIDLQQRTAANDERERSELESQFEMMHKEVYVGFHELESLLPGAEASEAEHPVLAAALDTAEVEAKRPLAPAPSALPDIPRDLASRLGPDGVQYLWDWSMRNKCYPKRSEDWSIALPHLIHHLIIEVSRTDVTDLLDGRDPTEFREDQAQLYRDLIALNEELLEKAAEIQWLKLRVRRLEAERDVV